MEETEVEVSNETHYMHYCGTLQCCYNIYLF